jgi:hypothetical protein
MAVLPHLGRDGALHPRPWVALHPWDTPGEWDTKSLAASHGRWLLSGLLVASVFVVAAARLWSHGSHGNCMMQLAADASGVGWAFHSQWPVGGLLVAGVLPLHAGGPQGSPVAAKVAAWSIAITLIDRLNPSDCQMPPPNRAC